MILYVLKFKVYNVYIIYHKNDCMSNHIVFVNAMKSHKCQISIRNIQCFTEKF